MMIGSERHEFEATPRRCGIELTTVRPNADRVAAQLRQSLPVALGEVLAEMPGATLRLSLLTDVDGMVTVRLDADGGEDTAALAGAVADILQPVAEIVDGSESTPEAVTWWPVTAERHSGALGFGTHTSVRKVTLAASADAATGQLVEDLATLPGEGVCVELRSRGEAPKATWEAQIWVLTTGGAPSLRMRAAIRRRFPDLQIASDILAEAAQVHVEAVALPTVLAVPVAGASPLAGTYPGPAAPIPVAPDRRRTAPGLLVGHAVTGGGRRIPVELTETERLRHLHVLGQTGTGKSSALAGMLAGIAARGDGALVADAHGQLCDRVLAELPDSARDRVWLIRCGDVDNPVPLNPLAESDPVRRDIAIQDVCAAFQYLFDKGHTGIVGPRFHDHVGMTLRALAAVHGTRASLLDVPLACTDEAFMTTAVARADNDRLKSWWRTFKLSARSNEHGEVLAWVNSKFGPLTGTAAMRAILGSGANAIDFSEAMDQGRIILLDLSKTALGESASRLLGYLYLSRVWESALRRQRPDRPFTVMVDEAHTLISGALTNMLAEGRKFGLSVVLAHQYLDQLDEDLRPAVNGNVATTIAFRCAAGDAGQLARRLGGAVDPSALVTLPDLNAITLRSAAPGPAFPHTLMIDYNDRAIPRVGVDLAQHTDEVISATYRALIDPYREMTGAATAGVSNIQAIQVEMPAAPQPTPPIPAARRPGAAPKPAPDTSSSNDGGTFLDDWLAKRQRTAAAVTQEGGACEPESTGNKHDSNELGDDRSASDSAADTPQAC
ncbi:type IV secretory system conjugative DNA transfer family protein [Mycolicibacterium llatzerense]|uniref:type IV secretory system conjugative DNA transfer family protein n=1 Tax=Mycolicibacterium llatzerense TaxID=280871 RepID=UPI0008DE2360|nr:type IV secretion system DNA-binding domain-containing protein [Mycolicibacterium llatzerense]